MGMEVVKGRKAMWLYPRVTGFNPPERWGHSACFFEGVVYIFGVSMRWNLHFSVLLSVSDASLWLAGSKSFYERLIWKFLEATSVLHTSAIVIYCLTSTLFCHAHFVELVLRVFLVSCSLCTSELSMAFFSFLLLLSHSFCCSFCLFFFTSDSKFRLLLLFVLYLCVIL